MMEKGISGRAELVEADNGLYRALLKRKGANPGILEKAGFVAKLREPRDWEDLDDNELVAHTRKFMQEAGISGRRELMDADSGLYHALLKREKARPGLVQMVGFEKKKPDFRNWKSMNDDEIVAHARSFLEENGISTRKEFRAVDYPLYQELIKRQKRNPGLMDGHNAHHQSILSSSSTVPALPQD